MQHDLHFDFDIYVVLQNIKFFYVLRVPIVGIKAINLTMW